METIRENVESLVEKVQEMLPHHATEGTAASAGNAPYSTNAGSAQYTSTERVSWLVHAYISYALHTLVAIQDVHNMGLAESCAVSTQSPRPQEVLCIYMY